MATRADRWTSRMTFVLVSIGAAVGLGNIWRFPYIASENGGIWFLLPYVVCLVAVGIPLFMLEAGQGFLSRKGFFKAVEQSTDVPFVRSSWRRAVGALPVLVSTAIMSYYAVLCCWTLWFAVDFVLGKGSTFATMQNSFTPVLAYIVVGALAFWVVTKKINKGIEYVARYMVPLLFVSMIALFAYALTLPGAMGYILKGTSGGFHVIFDAKTWYFALAQVFFSMSVGYGLMFTNGIYLRKGKEIFASAFQVAGADTLVSVLALFTVMIFGSVLAVAPSGFAFSFEALPAFFASKGIAGAAMGTALFALLFSAAFTSLVVMIKHTMVSTEHLLTGKKLAVWVGVFVLGLLAVLSYTPLRLSVLGKPILDQLDFTFGTFLAPFSALAVVLACAYLLPHERLAKAIGVPKKYAKLFTLLTKEVIPIAIVLLILFAQAAGLY